jgi:glycerol-3-phosphate O-acyltransferase
VRATLALTSKAMNPNVVRPYAPNPLLEQLYARFFRHMRVDAAWVDSIRAAAARGTVVYVQRNLSFVDFLALDYLTKREGLPRVHFANDLGLFILEPMGKGWWNAIERSARSLGKAQNGTARDVDKLEDVLCSGASAALFLKRPPTVLEPGARGLVEGDAYLHALLRVQRRSERPIVLCPQVFIWSRGPDQAQASGLDLVFGPREWPGKMRTIAQFLSNYRDVTLRSGDPVDLREVLRGSSASDEVVIRSLTYTLLRRMERERRSVTGPVQKPVDRVRAEVLRSPKLTRTIRDLAGDDVQARAVISSRAGAMIQELEATMDPSAVAALNRVFDATVARMYSALEVDEVGLERLRELTKGGSLILLPSHRSHLDYIVLTRVFFQARMPVPLVAAGDNLDFFPVGGVLRRAGAFFIRRKFQGDRLYASVVDAYMRRIVREGYPLEFFLEGGRSRSGKVLSPKLGLLSIVVDAALGVPERRVWFCPISISYERTVEEQSYAKELVGREKRKESFRELLRSARTLGRTYGRLSVQFGTPIHLDELAEEVGAPPSSAGLPSPPKRRAMITRLAHRVMNEINQIATVSAGSLVATALLSHDRRGITHTELVSDCAELARVLDAEGARFSPALKMASGAVSETALMEACTLFHSAKQIALLEVAAEGRAAKPNIHAVYTVPENARVHLDQAKNAIVHFLVARALVATAILCSREDEEALDIRVQGLSRMFKFEFVYRTERPFDALFESTLSALLADGHVIRRGSEIAALDIGALKAYAMLLRNFLEGYRIAARALSALHRGALEPKELIRKALSVGEKMYVAREVERREAISSSIFENAFLAFVDQGFLIKREGKLELTESFATPKASAAIEQRFVSFLHFERH